MEVTFFTNRSEFRQWLSKNHDSANELWVGYYKKATGLPSMTWEESVDEALCYGWIDGIRKKIDEKSYCIRFTPRRVNSNWSAVNIRRVEMLKKLGQMQPAGINAFNRKNQNPAPYSHETAPGSLTADFENSLKSNPDAWKYFNKLAPSYRKMSINWVMSAKREATRERRFSILMESSIKGEKIPPLNIGRK